MSQNQKNLAHIPEGKTPTVRGIGGSPSFCCNESATTKKARRPILILSGVIITLIEKKIINKHII